jgi:hypothetical protein
MRSIAEWLPTRKRPERDVQADRRADSRQHLELDAEMTPALDLGHVGLGDADQPRDASLTEAVRQPGGVDLTTEIHQSAP